MRYTNVINKQKLTYALKKSSKGLGSLYSRKIIALFGLNPNLRLTRPRPVFYGSRDMYLESSYLFKKQAKLFFVSKFDTKKKENSLFLLKYNKVLRKHLHLPIHGQRTHTNAQTAKKLNN